MFLFIFESIGTSELILVGVVALIFLGPRRLPEMARKLGKIMSEFRGTANEFKETWTREVNFEEEAKLLNIKDIETDTVARDEVELPAAPEIREVDPTAIEELKRRAERPGEKAPASEKAAAATDPNDKKNWL